MVDPVFLGVLPWTEALNVPWLLGSIGTLRVLDPGPLVPLDVAAAEVHYFAERGFAESDLTERNALASVRT